VPVACTVRTKVSRLGLSCPAPRPRRIPDLRRDRRPEKGAPPPV